jgi:hypothetical protein
MEFVPSARPAFLEQRLSVGGTQHDVGIVCGHQRLERRRLVLWKQDQRVAGNQASEVGHQGVDVVRRSQRHQAPLGAQPEREGINPVGQFPVGESEIVGENGGPVPVACEIGGEGHPREIKLRGHRKRILVKAYLSKTSRWLLRRAVPSP